MLPTVEQFSGRILNRQTSRADSIAPSRHDDRPNAVPAAPPPATLRANLRVMAIARWRTVSVVRGSGRNTTESNSWKLPMNLLTFALEQTQGARAAVARFEIGTGASSTGRFSPRGFGVGPALRFLALF